MQFTGVAVARADMKSQSAVEKMDKSSTVRSKTMRFQNFDFRIWDDELKKYIPNKINTSHSRSCEIENNPNELGAEYNQT